MKLPYRQLHIDFHTSGDIRPLCADFSPENFEEALKLGHVNSVTLFSKCHHGYSYHPTAVGEMNPGLDFDLLGEQIKVCQKLGIRTEVYLSAGLDERVALAHREWVALTKEEWDRGAETEEWEPGYHKVCFNTPYLKILTDEIQEAITGYPVEGLFLDIVGPYPCVCASCRRILAERGQSPDDPRAVDRLAVETHYRYTHAVKAAVEAVRPGLPIFHNSGHIRRGLREMAYQSTHLEMESLPTGGWGYDHFPVSASYVPLLEMDYIGMTGKFHESWGDFGTFKHPNALRYETALSLAMGAGCSVGDQLHPCGKMDLATYSLIGKAYAEVEKKEGYVDGKKRHADVAVLSLESLVTDISVDPMNLASGREDVGAGRILLEEHFLFDFIDQQADFSRYRVIILPDEVLCTGILEEKLKAYVAAGGKLLATNHSGQNIAGEYVFDFGCVCEGDSLYDPAYLRPLFETGDLDTSNFLMCGTGVNLRTTTGTVLGKRIDPYFNRTKEHFTGHAQTPENPAALSDAIVEGADGIAVAFPLFRNYANNGHLIHRLVIAALLRRLLGESITLRTDLVSGGVTTLMQDKDSQTVLHHLLYAPKQTRGLGVQIIEELPPLHGVTTSIRLTSCPQTVISVPDNTPLSFTYENGWLTYTRDIVDGHAMTLFTGTTVLE